ncbi:MAG: hypothetical protein CSA58_07365, partial [Micrococcales bacterium]
NGDQTPTAEEAPGRNVSSDLFTYEQPEPIASTSGDLKTSYWSEPVTLEILELRSTPTATRLTYRLTADQSTVHGVNGHMWAEQPRLIDQDTNQAYLVLTTGHPDSDKGRIEIALITGDNATGRAAPPQEGLYPTLPENLTEIDVTMPGLKPTTVPITR